MSSFAIITNSIRRSRELIEKSLHASLQQDGVKSVIFLDQNLELLALSSDLRRNSVLKTIHALVPSVSQARNLAVYPQVDWLIFCDDDGYMDVQYAKIFSRLISEFPRVDIFCGSIKRTDTGDYYSKRHAVGGDMAHFWNTKLLMGSNFCVRREVFEALGKFDENFGAGSKYGSSEETDFAWAAFFSGYTMMYAKDLVVFHVPPFAGELWPEMKKAFRYGRGKSALIKKWLRKGKFTVMLEVAEMFVVPWLRMIQFLLQLRFKEISIQFATLLGRCAGFFV